LRIDYVVDVMSTAVVSDQRAAKCDPVWFSLRGRQRQAARRFAEEVEENAAAVVGASTN
jgi:hypothetical protein